MCVQDASTVIVPSVLTSAVIPRRSPLLLYVNASYQKTCHISPLFKGVISTSGSRNLSMDARILLSLLEYAAAFNRESMGGSTDPL